MVWSAARLKIAFQANYRSALASPDFATGFTRLDLDFQYYLWVLMHSKATSWRRKFILFTCDLLLLTSAAELSSRENLIVENVEIFARIFSRSLFSLPFLSRLCVLNMKTAFTVSGGKKSGKAFYFGDIWSDDFAKLLNGFPRPMTFYARYLQISFAKNPEWVQPSQWN